MIRGGYGIYTNLIYASARALPSDVAVRSLEASLTTIAFNSGVPLFSFPSPFLVRVPRLYRT